MQREPRHESKRKSNIILSHLKCKKGRSGEDLCFGSDLQRGLLPQRGCPRPPVGPAPARPPPPRNAWHFCWLRLAAAAAHRLGIRKNTWRGNGKRLKMNNHVPEHATRSPARKTRAAARARKHREVTKSRSLKPKNHLIDGAWGRNRSKAARASRKEEIP